MVPSLSSGVTMTEGYLCRERTECARTGLILAFMGSAGHGPGRGCIVSPLTETWLPNVVLLGPRHKGCFLKVDSVTVPLVSGKIQ